MSSDLPQPQRKMTGTVIQHVTRSTLPIVTKRKYKPGRYAPGSVKKYEKWTAVETAIVLDELLPARTSIEIERALLRAHRKLMRETGVHGSFQTRMAANISIIRNRLWDVFAMDLDSTQFEALCHDYTREGLPLSAGEKLLLNMSMTPRAKTREEPISDDYLACILRRKTIDLIHAYRNPKGFGVV